jgi:hypothetical protein
MTGRYPLSRAAETGQAGNAQWTPSSRSLPRPRPPDKYTNAPKAFGEARFRAFAIQHYRSEVAGAMLERLVMFSADPVFRRLADELAETIRCDRTTAAMLLWSASSALYRAADAAAQEVADGPL